VRGFCIIVAVLVLAGCGGGGAYVQIRPEHLYERPPADAVAYQKVGDLDVQRTGFGLLGFPISVPNVVAAVESAIQEANADAVMNMEVQSRLQGIFFLGTVTKFRVRGDLIRFEGRNS
jgi:hypothetical protein